MYAYINNWTRGHKKSIFSCAIVLNNCASSLIFFVTCSLIYILAAYICFVDIFIIISRNLFLTRGQDIFKQGDSRIFGSFFYVLYSTLLHLPPLRFHCIGGCWGRTQDYCDFGIGSQTGQDMSSLLVHLQMPEKKHRSMLFTTKCFISAVQFMHNYVYI